MGAKLKGQVARLAVLASVTCACASSDPGTPPAPGPDEIAWTPFRWVSATIGGRTFDKAALYVPLTADTLSGTYWLQLDTGADSDVWLHTAPLDQLLSRRGAVRDTTTWFEIPTGRIGTYPLRNHAVNIRGFAGDTVRADDPLPKIGTLGLNFFRTRALLLDFPAERFAIIDSATAIPAWIEEGASWVDVDYRSDKMFLPLTLAGTTYEDFFYDSGASLFPVSTSKPIWQRATGRTGDEPDNIRWTVRSFGEDVTLIGAPARGRVAVGAAALERPIVYFVAEGPGRVLMENFGFRTSGLIGNALFAERYLVVIDLPHRRFGLVERQAP